MRNPGEIARGGVRRIRAVQKDLSLKLVARKVSFEPFDALILCGDPRGGSTWLAELVRGLRGTAMLWEPLDIGNVSEFRELGFAWRQYIPENGEWPEAYDLFEALFRGQLLNGHIGLRVSPSNIQRAERLLVKFCRANQLLPWLVRQFGFTRPPIYLVRHPCAVIASQMKQGGWDHVRSGFEIPHCRYEEFYREHEDYLLGIRTVEQRLAAHWCLCNGVPLKHKDNDRSWITMTYESLLMDADSELARIERRWNIAFPKEVRESVGVASHSTLASSPVAKGRQTEQLGLWRQRLNDDQIQNILSVLDHFAIDLYTDDLKPTKTFV